MAEKQGKQDKRKAPSSVSQAYLKRLFLFKGAESHFNEIKRHVQNQIENMEYDEERDKHATTVRQYARELYIQRELNKEKRRKEMNAYISKMKSAIENQYSQVSFREEDVPNDDYVLTAVLPESEYNEETDWEIALIYAEVQNEWGKPMGLVVMSDCE